jgi:hypothetical protein
VGTLGWRCAGLAIVLLLAGCGPAATEASDPPGRIRLSWLALGDTGVAPRPWVRPLQTQMRVGAALEAEHRRRPVDALVLLGDNFQPEGLAEKDLVRRVRANLVAPYCGFLALDGASWPAVADACEPERRGERPVPIYALLGDRDRRLPESPRMQREAIPRFVPNWRVPPGAIEVVELADSDLVPSVSLVLYDAMELADEGDAAALAHALAEARGPWRILAGHYPIGAAHPGPWVRAALAAIETPVHLHLAAHEANLQVGAQSGGDPPLQVVAGSGASQRPVRDRVDAFRFAAEQPGFARIDLVGDGDAARLVVTLVALPRSSLAFRQAPRAIARWSVGAGGDVREEAHE